MFTHCSLDLAENKLDCYKGEDCMEKFCKGSREHAMKILTKKKRDMTLVTDEEYKVYGKQKACYICKKEFSTDENDKKCIYTIP